LLAQRDSELRGRLLLFGSVLQRQLLPGRVLLRWSVLLPKRNARVGQSLLSQWLLRVRQYLLPKRILL
jgi:hypothetical protein